MFNSPFDVVPPSPDDPGPRFDRPLSARDLRAIFGDPDPELDDRPDLYEALRELNEPSVGEAFWVLLGVSAALWSVAIYAAVKAWFS